MLACWWMFNNQLSVGGWEPISSVCWFLLCKYIYIYFGTGVSKYNRTRKEMNKTKSLLGNGTEICIPTYKENRRQIRTAHSSQRGPVAKGRHRHWPVSTSQADGGRLPNGLQLQAESTMTRSLTSMSSRFWMSSGAHTEQNTWPQSSQACPAPCLPSCMITVWHTTLPRKSSARHSQSPRVDLLDGS